MSALIESDEAEGRKPHLEGGGLDSAARLYQPGDIIAQKYLLTRLLGEGGMGAVWLAHNEKLDVDVAIKLIRYERATAETSERLLQEARAAARIGHRSIVRVFDFGETELSDPFIVMELLTGESLRALLERKGRLPATQAVRTILPLASALVEAHTNGIVHRDLKPENVMLVPDTSGGVVPKLLDFGIAQFREGEEDSEDARGGALVVGTPEYMPPEQAGGRDAVDEHADVWALAVILYEAITGHVPFSGPTHAALIFAIMTEEPAPITEQLAGDAKLWSILRRALAKQPADRPSMRELGTALAEWAIDAGVDSDVAGSSLGAHWIYDTRHPFSALPPPVAPRDRPTEDLLVLPKAAALPKDLDAPTQAPPTLATPRATGRARMVLGVAALAATAALAAVTLWQRAPRAAPPEGAALPAAVRPPPAAESVAPSARVDEANGAAASAEPTQASARPTAAPAPVAEPEPAPLAPSGKALRKRPPRKSNLPIAKQPNF
jgi:serine/threonine-protein kinase